MLVSAFTRFRIIAVLFIVGAGLYCSWPLGFLLNPAAMRAGLASELGAMGAPYAWLFNGSDVVSGVFLLAGGLLLLRRLRLPSSGRVAVWSVIIYGVCGGLDAILPESCLPSQQTCGPIFKDPVLVLHGAFDFAGSAALIVSFIALFVVCRGTARKWLPWIYSIGLGGVLFAAVSLYFIVYPGPGYIAQRFYLTLSSVWVASLPWLLRTGASSQTIDDLPEGVRGSSKLRSKQTASN